MHQQERRALVITRVFVLCVLQGTGMQAAAPCLWVEYKQSVSHARNSHCVTLPLARLRPRHRSCGLLLCSDSQASPHAAGSLAPELPIVNIFPVALLFPKAAVGTVIDTSSHFSQVFPLRTHLSGE